MLAFGAEDPWAKVKALKSGAEIRVYKQGDSKPITGKFDEADDERLLMVVKNEQTSIPKDNILRLDARPNSGTKVTRDEKSSSGVVVGGREGTPTTPNTHTGTSGSYSSSVSVGKEDYEVVYRKIQPIRKTQPIEK